MQFNIKKFIERNGSYCVLLPLIVGLHIGWFTLQQRYVSKSQKHDHPIVELFKKFST
ncbi:hypothetical protein ALC57_07510 [Trachymyrmex cornetzi]|uniref:Uncharacterized protein n=1 Tax=Trachymyrmex cornetzi TaxID=471704 RepID=A0A195E5U1_9HYME|nr:hypothetical protein ALC57_07510 [Trachymyrmex cornetzi]